MGLTKAGFGKMMAKETMTVECLEKLTVFFGEKITYWFNDNEPSMAKEPAVYYEKACLIENRHLKKENNKKEKRIAELLKDKKNLMDTIEELRSLHYKKKEVI